MTVKLSISVPDDIAADLQSQGNASTAVVDTVRRVRQREAAQTYGEYLRRRSTRQADDDRAMIEDSNDIALSDSQW
jgi:hypothetical protein